MRSKRRRPTSSTGPAASRWSAPTSASTCSTSPRRQPERADPGRLDQHRRAGRPGRTPAMSARSRSTPQTGEVAGRRLRLGQRHRPGRQPDDRRAARSTAARCRASARRSASRSSTTPTAASCVTGSFMDYAYAARRATAPRFTHRVRHHDPVPHQPARRQGRRRARHDRRDAGGGQRGRRRPRPRRPPARRRRDPDAGDGRSGSGRPCRRSLRRRWSGAPSSVLVGPTLGGHRRGWNSAAARRGSGAAAAVARALRTTCAAACRITSRRSRRRSASPKPRARRARRAAGWRARGAADAAQRDGLGDGRGGPHARRRRLWRGPGQPRLPPHLRPGGRPLARRRAAAARREPRRRRAPTPAAVYALRRLRRAEPPLRHQRLRLRRRDRPLDADRAAAAPARRRGGGGARRQDPPDRRRLGAGRGARERRLARGLRPARPTAGARARRCPARATTSAASPTTAAST